MTTTPPREKKFYVSNKDLFQHYLKWYAAIEETQKAGLEDPPLPPEIIDAIQKICTKLSYRPNFSAYSWREDMVAEAIMNNIINVKKFNPLKSENPFAYITQIAWNSFLSYIKLEKNQTYVKAKLITEIPLDQLIEIDSDDEMSNSMNNTIMEYLREHAYIAGTEAPKKKKKVQLAEEEISLEDFIEDVSEKDEE